MMNKKVRELAQIELVRSRMAGLPTGLLTPHEAPDALVTHPGGVLGFEVTNLYPQADAGTSPVQAQESERRTIVERAQAIAAERNVPPLLVAVHFHDAASLHKSERDDLARTIEALVEGHHPPAHGIVRLGTRHPLGPPLPPQVHSIGIHRIPDLTRHSWSAVEGDVVAEDFPHVIQGAIDVKATELPRYLTACDACHLVIVSGVETSRPVYEASPATLSHQYRSPFSRTFYLEGFANRVFELNRNTLESDGIA